MASGCNYSRLKNSRAYTLMGRSGTRCTPIVVHKTKDLWYHAFAYAHVDGAINLRGAMLMLTSRGKTSDADRDDTRYSVTRCTCTCHLCYAVLTIIFIWLMFLFSW